jgi:hypothetical protein
MATNAGVISIDVTAGTAKMVLELEQAKGKIREFGSAGESEHKKVAAAVKALEGNIFNNTRAADAFLLSMKGLGPVIQAAFPIIGAVAFAGVIGELGKKVYEFFKELKEAPEKAALAWNNLTRPIKTTADELDLTNAKLEQDIAKLEGKRQNNLAIALAEAKVEADKLNDSLQKNLDSMTKLLSEETSGWKTFLSFFNLHDIGGESNDPIKGLLRTSKRASLRQDQLGELESSEIDKVKDQKLNSADEEKALHAIRERFGALMKQVETDVLKEAESVAKDSSLSETNRIIGEKMAIAMRAQLHQVDASNLDADLTAKQKQLQTGIENAKPGKLVQDRINAMKAEVVGLQEVLKNINASETQQVKAKAYADALKTIEELNKALEQYHVRLSAANAAEVQAEAAKKAALQTDIQSEQHFKELNASIKERITAQEDLAKSIGATYEVAQEAFAKTEVAKAIKGHEDDPKWLTEHSKDIEQIHQGGLSVFAAEQNKQVEATVKLLTDQITLEQMLAAAQYQGAEAVRQADLEYKIMIATRGKTLEQSKEIAESMRSEYQAQRVNAENAATHKFTEEGAASERIGSAAFGGAEAERQQKLIEEYRKLLEEGASVDQVFSKAYADQAAHLAQINTEAGQLVTHYSDQLQHLNDIRDALEAQRKTTDDTLQIDIALRHNEIDRLEIEKQKALESGKAGGQLTAFFAEAQANALKTSTILYDSLNSALDRISDQFADLFSGKKTSFGKMFQELGQSTEKSAIKKSLQTGLGAIGEHLPGKWGDLLKKTTVGKPDGSSEGLALWVKLVDKAKAASIHAPDSSSDSNSSEGTGDADEGIGGGGGGVSPGLFGSGSMGWLSTIFSLIPHMAGGGDVNPYSSYIVGEHAPEFFVPRTAGTIVPMNKAGFGGGVTYSIDARGAALGVENRIAQGIAASHDSAVQTSVRANHERSMRTPQKRG